MSDIHFYSHTAGPHVCLSNFHPSPVEIDGKTWPTVEHYFQAMKSRDKAERERVRKAGRPHEAKKLGRKVQLRRDWERVKDDVMHRALLAKFTQHEDLRKVLLSTGDAELHEDSPTDMYWGCRGKDMLGKLLMRARKMIAEETNPQGGAQE